MPDVPLDFALPLAFDLGATFAFGLTGAVAAVRRGYDPVGLFALTFVTAAGGGLIRDALFLRSGAPAVLLRSEFLIVVVLAAIAGWWLGDRLDRMGRFYEVIDAVGLGVYAIVGSQKALAAELSLAAAILVGTVNACGGGLLRDILIREEPLLFKPGGFYASAAVVGAALFVMLVAWCGWSATTAAFVAIPAAFLARMLSLIFGWQTVALRRERIVEEPPVSGDGDRV